MTKKCILLVDDESIILLSLSRELREAGYEVVTADNGEQALALLKKTPVDLVITDLMMEGLDGIQVLKETKRFNPALPVMILTGFAEVNAAIDALRLGADDYLLKPCDIDELLLRIPRCLEKQHLLEQLRRRNQTLLEEITARIQAEEALKENAEKIKRFASSISHDLKSPIIAIDGLIKRLQRQYGAKLGEKGALYCKQIAKISEQLIALITSINVYMSAKEAMLTIEEVNLAEIVRLIEEEFTARLDARQVRLLTPEHLPRINADKLSLLRALRNLVDNALKYGGDSLTEIVVNYEDSPQFHTIYVTDNGIGLDDEDADKIFDIFQRSGSAKGIDGTGLGLAIVREIARQHGGRVEVKSGQGRGCNFSLHIAKELVAEHG